MKVDEQSPYPWSINNHMLFEKFVIWMENVILGGKRLLIPQLWSRGKRLLIPQLWSRLSIYRPSCNYYWKYLRNI